jgi:transposase-like protein
MSSKLTIPDIPDDTWRGVVERLIEELTDDIPEKVIKATELLLAQYPVGKVAKQVGVSPDTVKSWIRKYPTVAHVLADGRKYLQMWRMAQLEQQFLKAVEKSEEILDLSLHDTDVNQKLVATVAQHARFIIGLHVGQQVDINVHGTGADPVMKAKSDAMDYLIERMASMKNSGEPITVNYRVVDERSSRPLLDQQGEPAYGKLGEADVNQEGTLCHICGQRKKVMSLHIAKDHDMKVKDYEKTFLLEPGTIGQLDSTDFEE